MWGVSGRRVSATVRRGPSATVRGRGHGVSPTVGAHEASGGVGGGEAAASPHQSVSSTAIDGRTWSPPSPPSKRTPRATSAASNVAPAVSAVNPR